MSSIADIISMDTITWRVRLEAALKERGLSKRAVSLDSGNGPGYVHSILSEGKEPTIEKLSSVCRAAGVSMSYILYGYNISPEDEAVIEALHESPEKRSAVLTLLGRQKAS